MCPLGSLRVLWEFVGKLSHIESLLWVLYKEPSGHIVIELLGTLWKNSKGSFTKYPLGSFWTIHQITKGVRSKSTHWVLCWILCKSAHHLPAGYKPGKLMGTFWKYPLLTYWVWARQIVSEPTINSQCTHWVYCPSPPVNRHSESGWCWPNMPWGCADENRPQRCLTVGPNHWYQGGGKAAQMIPGVIASLIQPFGSMKVVHKNEQAWTNAHLHLIVGGPLVAVAQGFRPWVCSYPRGMQNLLRGKTRWEPPNQASHKFQQQCKNCASFQDNQLPG